MKCKATSKRTKQPCGAKAVRGRNLCYHHGGKSLTGIANPAFKDGSRSRYMLPLRMRADYETALSDPRLLDLKPEIAVVHARVKDLTARVDSGESGHLWKLLQKAYRDLETAEGKDEQLAALATLGQLIKRGAADYAAWTEAMKEIDRKQRLVESERKRAVELHQTMTLDVLKPIIFAIIDFVRRRVPDRDGLIEFQSILETHVGTGIAGVPTATVVDGEPAA